MHHSAHFISFNYDLKYFSSVLPKSISVEIVTMLNN